MILKRSTASVMLKAGAGICAICGVLVLSSNISGMDMSDAPLHGPFSMEGHLKRLRFYVALCGLGMFVLGICVLAYMRSRADRSGSS